MPILKDSIRYVKEAKFQQTMYQLRLDGIFHEHKQNITKDQEGFSRLHSNKDFELKNY